MLTLKLKHLDLRDVRGIYGRAKDELPPRMRYLHPDAAEAFKAIAPYVVVSDMFRSPESSLAAKATGRGAKAPGYSGHNFGLSIDIDVDAALRQEFPMTGKGGLDEWMAARGWHCHRGDHKRGREDWHYNFLPSTPTIYTSARALEERILVLYGDQLAPCSVAVEQGQLSRLKLYTGDNDGKAGPLTRAAREVFARAWNVKPGTKAYFRTLAYVACDRSIENS